MWTLFGKESGSKKLERPIEWHLDWLGNQYPVRLTIERRKNSRVSFGKTALNIRLSSYLSEAQRQNQLEKFLRWAQKHVEENGIQIGRKIRDYESLETLILCEREYEINFAFKERKTLGVKVESELISIACPLDFETGMDKEISSAVSRAVGRHFQPEIKERLLDFNYQFINREIKELRLKQNHTNWGSCSNMGNINISTKLLQAPNWVIDYVLIHELCHLIHPNHSKNFWNEVESIDPNYLESEKWLKENGPNCYY